MKYMGSKLRLSKDLVPIINDLIKNNNPNSYIEPFVGGANLIDKIKCNRKIGVDHNDYLISMWIALQNGYEPPEHITREEYNHIKDNKDDYPKELVAIAGFCATYNAKWFGGYAGIVNTKVGTQRNYYDESIRNIKKQLPNVVDVIFKQGCYSDINVKDCIIYCDPPYQSTTGYKDVIDYNEYWNWVRRQSINNIVLCSEYNAPSDFEVIFEKELTTTLDKNSRKKDTEKLFVLSGKLNHNHSQIVTNHTLRNSN